MHYGWLGKPHVGDIRGHMSEMGVNGKSWVSGAVISSERQPGFCLSLNFISAPHNLHTESCSAAVFTSWHKFIFICWPITPTASTVVYFLLLHPLELPLTVSLLSRDGLFGTGACRPAKLMDHICYLTSCKGSSFRTACSCCGHLQCTGRGTGHCPGGTCHPGSSVSFGTGLLLQGTLMGFALENNSLSVADSLTSQGEEAPARGCFGCCSTSQRRTWLQGDPEKPPPSEAAGGKSPARLGPLHLGKLFIKMRN